VWTFLTATSALLFVAGLLLLFSRFQALAQPAMEVADLEVEKTVNVDVAEPGDVLTYTVQIWNNSGALVSTWLTDDLPAALTYIPDSLNVSPDVGSSDYAGGVITWTHDMTAGLQIQLSFSAQISSTYEGWITNTAEIVAPGQSFTPSAGTQVYQGQPQLEAFKSVSPGWARPGEYLTYTVRIANTGDGTVDEAQMTDALPPEVNLAGTPQVTKGNRWSVDDVITWTVSLAPSEAATITFAAQIESSVSENTRFTNTAEITGAGSPVQASVGAVARTSFDVYLNLVFRYYPPVPVLNPIPAPGDSTYTVSWSAVPVPVDRYVLQEATDANFDTVTEEWELATTETSQAISKSSTYGTFYYRVRADDDDWWGQGPWSNVESATIWGYFDDFSDYESGWPREWSKTRGALYQVRPYEHPGCPGSDCSYDEGDGYVIARRSGSKPYARFGPGVAVPSENYEMELHSRWWDSAYFATKQIFFGADSSFKEYYAVQVRINIVEDSSTCEYSMIRHTPTASVAPTKFWQDWTYSDAIHCRLGSERPGASWNHWVIRRENNDITVYVNGVHLGTWDDSKYGANRYFGVGCTLYEGFTPSKPEFDNWSVVLLP